MKASWLPVLFTVGQVIIFPYYILWLKELALTYTLFALLFAVHSFAAALGYVVCKRVLLQTSAPIYISSGLLYSAVFVIDCVYGALLLQLALGFLQGYFRAWHMMQPSYQANAVQHYIAVGVVMLMLAFVHILSPVMVIGSFGVVIVICGLVLLQKRNIAS